MESDTETQLDTPQPTPASSPGVVIPDVHADFISQLKHITSSIDSAFACGDSIPICVGDQESAQTGHACNGKVLPSIAPVIIRWDNQSGHDSRVGKMQFPSHEESVPADAGVDDPTFAPVGEDFDSQMTEPCRSPSPPKATNMSLEALLKACQGATFGLNGQDVYDETYRRALKLDETKFCTNFHPADCGVTDAIAQALLPAVTNSKSAYSGLRHFKSHVDTPRGMTQFGSLVVFLPYEHAGGTLVVRHGSQTMKFDFASQSGKPVLQWAAFYSNCEHEVLEVQSGHRVTLTYNLYARLGTGQLTSRLNAMDPTNLPLHGHARKMLQSEGFLTDGGIMGFYCTHDYAHATESAIKYLPWCLKGLDMIVYETFQALGCKVILRPVYPNPIDDYDEDGIDSEQEEAEIKELVKDIVSEMVTDTDPNKDPTEEQITRARELARQEFEDRHSEVVKLPGKTVIGKTMDGMQFVDKTGHDGCGKFSEVLEQYMNCMYMPDIEWLNNCAHLEPAVSYMAYGNQAELAYKYSSAAIFIKVPPASRRLAQTI